MHWSNPPHLVPMIEVVPGEQTTAGTTQKIVEKAPRSIMVCLLRVCTMTSLNHSDTARDIFAGLST